MVFPFLVQSFKAIDHYFNYKTLFYVLKYIAIPLLLITVTTFIITLILRRYLFDKRESNKNQLDQNINDFLINLIFSDYNVTQIKDEINNFKAQGDFKKKWHQRLILKKLISIKKNVKDISPNTILTIYRQFELNKYSKQLLRSRRWDHKALAFYHYQNLDYKIKYGAIKPYLYSKNKFLKSSALVAAISLSDEKFNILNNYSEKISRGDELRILDIIYSKKSTVPKHIGTWLHHRNSCVILLAINLIVRYREHLSNNDIKYLLMHNNSMVRKTTILAIRELFITDSNDLLIAHYNDELNIRNKISILKTFGVVGNEQVKHFVSNLVVDEKNLAVKFEMVNCLYKIDPHFFTNFKTTNLLEHNIINKIFLHVKNPYLN